MSHVYRAWRRAAAPAVAIAAILVATGASAKPKITKQDDLPRHTYHVKGTASELVSSIEAFEPFAGTSPALTA